MKNSKIQVEFTIESKEAIEAICELRNKMLAELEVYKLLDELNIDRDI